MTTHYSPRPWHLLFPLAMLALASVTIALEEWFWFGLPTMVFGWASGAWIIASGYFEAYGAYWDKVAHFGEVMARNRNPQVWAALGFTPPPETFRITDDNRDKQGLGTTSKFDLPCSPQAFSALCDGVLMGQPLSESFWVGNKTFASPTFRKLKKTLEDRQAIRLKIAGKPTQGFALTRKGRELFLEHCSAGVRQMVEETKCLVDTRPPSDKQLPA